MSISKIHLFSKNTDAVASVRGYEYQKLKTLEAWLQNGVNKNDELIYCEYEEDIFHRNEKTQVSKFRQLKLYSTNFSFATDEIKKAIIHFFALYTKGEYLFDNLMFVFEANSDVAKEYDGNEAKLLKLWFENQDTLQDELIQQCANKVKEIISEYYSEEYKKVNKDGDVPKEIEEGYALFQKLTDENWANFVKCIKWKFDSLQPTEAMTLVNESIKQLILELPHYIEKDNLSSIIGALYLEVSNRTVEEKPENRVLDVAFLDRIILEHGTEEDKWYSGIYIQWSQVKDLEYFLIGEFLEVIDAAQHCRRNKNLWKHSEVWINILNKYYLHENTPEQYKRKCVYELVWLNLKADTKTFKTTGSLKNLDIQLIFYFEDFNKFKSKEQLGDALNLLNILIGAFKTGSTNFTKEKIRSLVKEFYSKLHEEIKNSKDLNEKCKLLELLGFIEFVFNGHKNSEFEKAIQPWYEIITLLGQAPLYNVTQLSRTVNKIILLYIKKDFNKNVEIIEGLEKFSAQLEPFVLKRDGNYKAAKINIEKGITFLKLKEKDGILKSLNYFHKAKDQYFLNETIEGYILALLNIAQVYLFIGLNFASKYYALSALWISINNEKGKILKHIPQSFGFLFHIDFKQGAWQNALANFSDFVRMKAEFDIKNFDFEKDEMILKNFSEVSFIIFSIPSISSQMNVQLDFIKKSWGFVWDESIHSLVEELGKEIKSPEDLQKILVNKLDDNPLNDVGKRRTVRWHSLGSEWQVSFDNKSIPNSIAEEYCSILQIFLCEIELSNIDFHLIKGTVKINIQVGEEYLPPEQIGGNDQHEYNITLPQLITRDLKEVNMHNAQVGASLSIILSEISLLTINEFKEDFRSLFSTQSVASKSYTINTYQRIYREFYTDELFNLDQRSNYQPVEYNLLLKENKMLKWRNSLSNKYNKERAIEFISQRYIASKKVIYLTVERLKDDAVFKKVIKDRREEGWLDWQIIVAMRNYIADYKAKKKIEGKKFASQEEEVIALNKSFFEVVEQDENEFNVQFPAEAFLQRGFDMQFYQLPFQALKSWDLECRTKMPNFKAIHEFLNIRFNFNSDNLDDGNLLKDI